MSITECGDGCPICYWECDYGQESEPDYPYGANDSITLREAQQNYIKFGVCEKELCGQRGRKPRPGEVRNPEWRPFPAEPNPDEDAKAWRRPIYRGPIRCLCCGYETISQEGDICRICRWEDSGMYASFDVAYDRHEGTNDGLSLYEGQQNYQKFGAFSEKYLHLKTEPRPDDTRASWWKPADPPSDPSQFKTYAIEFCPCCGYRACHAQLCGICVWHRNEEQEHNPDIPPTDKELFNDVTFRQAQQNFLAFGKCSKKYVIGHPELKKDIRKYAPGPDDERDPNWKPLPPLPKNS
jgi:hypothetical protein